MAEDSKPHVYVPPGETPPADLVIEDLTTGPIAAGETGELVIDGLDPGEYDYYCSIPGHRDAGMEGRVLVG